MGLRYFYGQFLPKKCGIPTGSLENFSSKIAQRGTTEASNQPGPEKVSALQSIEKEKRLSMG